MDVWERAKASASTSMSWWRRGIAASGPETAGNILTVATHRKPEPERNPLDQVLDEEVAAIFKADPEFKAGLKETVERVRRGEEKLVSDAEVRRRLKRLDVPLDDAGA